MPTYFRVTTPVQGSDNITRFRNIGVAFPNREGSKAHMTIKLDAFPVNGELVLFEPKAGDTPDDPADEQ